MIPDGEADFPGLFSEDQIENNRYRCGDGGILIDPSSFPKEALSNPKYLEYRSVGYPEPTPLIWMKPI
jgi:hypothetical protein